MLNILSFNEKIIYIGDIMKKFILFSILSVLLYSAPGNAAGNEDPEEKMQKAFGRKAPAEAPDPVEETAEEERLWEEWQEEQRLSSIEEARRQRERPLSPLYGQLPVADHPILNLIPKDCTEEEEDAAIGAVLAQFPLPTAEELEAERIASRKKIIKGMKIRKEAERAVAAREAPAAAEELASLVRERDAADKEFTEASIRLTEIPQTETLAVVVAYLETERVYTVLADA